MINLLKNKEARLTLLAQILFCTAVGLFAFMLSVYAGLIAVTAAAGLIIINLVSTAHRYSKISSFAKEINQVLHGDSSTSFSDYSEGELAVLHSEIHKMTVRLREQQQTLQKDKCYLADSIADISHQIRTPLTSINLMLELLASSNTSAERRSELIMELRTMLDRIEWLITALLKISKLDTGTVQLKKETISLLQLIKNSSEPLLIPFELRDIYLSVKAEGNFTGDISWTCEAIGNILKNCMEHTPRGGRIEINCCENALYSQIEIKDSGPGIPSEDIPRIFERFYKGKNSDKNSFGIGLALARTIISSQNGTVKAENARPNGALFTLRFYKGTV